MRRPRWIALPALALALAACSATHHDSPRGAATGMAHGQAPAGERPVLYDSLGDYS